MIHTEQLTKRFGDNTAVSSLSLDVEDGEFFCFLGPNGAGKTTTIKMLTGLLKPTSGVAYVGHWNMAQDPVEAKKLIGYVPDHPFLYDKLTGREFLRFVAGLYQLSDGHVQARMESLLELFEIRDVGDHLIENYSHGMRQKLSFAACFLHLPKVVIVDEPWVGLDPKNIRFLKDYLKQKTREGITVFMSTHTLNIVEELADRVAIIDRGNLLHIGSVDETMDLAQNPQSLEEVFLELTGGGDA